MITPELLAGLPYILLVALMVTGPTILAIVLATSAGRVAKLRIEELEKRVKYLERARGSLRSERDELHARLENMTAVAANYAELLSVANGEIAYLREDLGRLDTQTRPAPAAPKPAKDRQIEPAAPTPVDVEPAAPGRDDFARFGMLEID